MNRNIKPPDQTLIDIRIHIPYTKLIIGIIIVLLIVVALSHFFILAAGEIISIAAAGFVVLSIWYNATSLLYSYEVHKHQIELEERTAISKENFERKIFTNGLISNYIHNFTDKAIICRDYIEDFNKSDKDQSFIASEVDSSPDLRKALVSVLNYFEMVSICEKELIADQGMIRDFFEGIFKKFYENFYPFIRKRAVGSNGMPRAFENFCALSLKYGAKKQQT